VASEADDAASEADDATNEVNDAANEALAARSIAGLKNLDGMRTSDVHQPVDEADESANEAETIDLVAFAT